MRGPYHRSNHAGGTMTTEMTRALLSGYGHSGLGADAAADAIGEPAIVKGVEGIWLKKPATCPTGYVKHKYSSKRGGWIFCVRVQGGYSHDITTGETVFTPVAAQTGVGPAVAPEPGVSHGFYPGQTETVIARESTAAGSMAHEIMADQPMLVPTSIASEPAMEVNKSQYKEQLRRTLADLKRIEAAYLVGLLAPAMPPRPLRPPGVSAGSTILSLEKKIEEFLIIRIPFARKTAGGTDQDPWPRPPGGAYPAPNQPSGYPDEALSPGAGQPELPFTGGGISTQALIPAPPAPVPQGGKPGGYYTDGSMMTYIMPGGAGKLDVATGLIREVGTLPGTVYNPIVGSDAVLSAPGATNEFGSGRIGSAMGTVPTWGWIALASVGALGLGWFLLRKKRR